METKRNYKYFTAKGLNPTFIVGSVIIIFGLILSIMPVTRVFGVIGMLVGAGVVVFGMGAKSGESDIDNQVYSQTKDIFENAMVKYEVYEKNFITIIQPVLLQGFDYLSEGIYCKKAPDHKFRTSQYNAAQLFFTKEKIYVYGKHFSLIDPSEEANYEFGGSYYYTDIDKAYIEDSTYTTAKGRQVAVHSFAIKQKNGNDIFKISVEYGADTDKAAEDINHVILKMTEKAQERAADKAAKRAVLRGETVTE